MADTEWKEGLMKGKIVSEHVAGRCPDCGITVLRSSDNDTGLCTGCAKWRERRK